MKDIKYPYRVKAEAENTSLGMTIYAAMSERSKIWMHEYTRCFDRLRDVTLECSVLKEENNRLKHENEFMLRLINERLGNEEI